MIADVQSFLKQDKILNYLDGVEIKMTSGKGRGVFASKDLKRGELIVVEKAIAESIQDETCEGFDKDDVQKNVRASQLALVKACTEIADLKGIEALRLSYLYDGSKKDELKLPP